jgi:hypothetical protein
VTATEQQPAAAEQQPAATSQQPGRKTQLPRFNYRVMVNFEEHQIKNIEVLKKKLGGTDNSVVRTAIDVLAYLNGLPVETDPGIYLNNFLVRANQLNGGGNNGR